MKQNPFTSKSFESIWSKHFNNAKEVMTFEFINGVSFLKHKFLPLHINVGKNLTKGIDYKLNIDAIDYKKKTFLKPLIIAAALLTSISTDPKSALILFKSSEICSLSVTLSIMPLPRILFSANI
mgnify:CR=1 FL=1